MATDSLPTKVVGQPPATPADPEVIIYYTGKKETQGESMDAIGDPFWSAAA
jgi:hypothetical protein